MSSLELLTSDAIAGARSTVGSAARAQQLNDSEKREFTAAAFRLMWAIQRSTFAAKTIRNTALAHEEAVWLYRHVDSITDDLNTAIKTHGSEIAWNPTLKHTNEVLTSLPEKVKNEWNKQVEAKSFKLLELPPQTPAPAITPGPTLAPAPAITPGPTPAPAPAPNNP
jgi:hypothetical protein